MALRGDSPDLYAQVDDRLRKLEIDVKVLETKTEVLDTEKHDHLADRVGWLAFATVILGATNVLLVVFHL